MVIVGVGVVVVVVVVLQLNIKRLKQEFIFWLLCFGEIIKKTVNQQLLILFLDDLGQVIYV